jgi:hypothetical protein
MALKSFAFCMDRATYKQFLTGEKMLLRCKRQFLLACLMMGCVCCFAPSLCPAGAGDQKPGAEKKTLNDKVKEIAGTAEFLRSVPKYFATLKGVDAPQHRVTLLLEGENLAKVWSLAPDAEIKRAGWWARLNELQVNDRVWVWFETDRHQQARAISMLCDELSEQEIHGGGVVLESFQANEIVVKPAVGKNRSIRVDKTEIFRGAAKAKLEEFKKGEKVYVQTTTLQGARLILDTVAFAGRKEEQKAALRKIWTEQGLPGAVVFLHRFSGEMDLMLDHEGMRWARSLKPGDAVRLQTPRPIPSVVKQVKPWRERTEVRLVVAAADLGDLTVGQRLALHMSPPAAEVEQAQLPPDLDRPRTRVERIDWFLASMYCPCGVNGDTCTGDFYTLASCNPNACGMPNVMRQAIVAKIDKGLTDRQIFEELLKEQGPDLLRQHLRP